MKKLFQLVAVCALVFSCSKEEPEQGLSPIDLGLSVQWANCNLGATAPEEYGDYFAWGEAEPYYEAGQAQAGNPQWKSGKFRGYYWTSYKWATGTLYEMTKYNTMNPNYGKVDNRLHLEKEDDTANLVLGGSWRMPTDAEWEELRSNCTWSWTNINGIQGYKVTSNKLGFTKSSIFLPAARYRYDTTIDTVNVYGFYWSSTVDREKSCNAQLTYFHKDYIDIRSYFRCAGLSIRPVTK